MKRLFKNIGSSRLYEDRIGNIRYLFKYFSEHLPYLPLPLVISQKPIIPVTVYNPSYRFGGSSSYKEMLRKTLLMHSNYLVESHTRGNNFFLYGAGCMFHVPDPELSTITPIFIMTLQSPQYHRQDIEEVIKKDKQYLEVFFHNDIRSVNQTLWGYIRNLYIPLLQLERISFQFKDPRQIMDLTMTSYKKPKFTSLEEMKDYKKELSRIGSLKNVFNNTSIKED